jgi:rubrerythrin
MARHICESCSRMWDTETEESEPQQCPYCEAEGKVGEKLTPTEEGMDKRQCEHCGHIWWVNTPPNFCPKCGGPQGEE